MDIQVIKRDGIPEPFSLEKITRVVVAAGLEEPQATTLANNVYQEILASGKNPVTSLQVRDLVIGQLHHTNENVANFFTWYQKTKDATTQ